MEKRDVTRVFRQAYCSEDMFWNYINSLKNSSDFKVNIAKSTTDVEKGQIYESSKFPEVIFSPLKTEQPIQNKSLRTLWKESNKYGNYCFQRTDDDDLSQPTSFSDFFRDLSSFKRNCNDSKMTPNSYESAENYSPSSVYSQKTSRSRESICNESPQSITGSSSYDYMHSKTSSREQTHHATSKKFSRFEFHQEIQLSTTKKGELSNLLDDEDPHYYNRCKFFLKSSCTSKHCAFIHRYPKEDKIDCKYFLRNGCDFSSTACIFLHDEVKRKQLQLSSLDNGHSSLLHQSNEFKKNASNASLASESVINYGGCVPNKHDSVKNHQKRDRFENNSLSGSKLNYSGQEEHTADIDNIRISDIENKSFSTESGEIAEPVEKSFLTSCSKKNLLMLREVKSTNCTSANLPKNSGIVDDNDESSSSSDENFDNRSESRKVVIDSMSDALSYLKNKKNSSLKENNLVACNKVMKKKLSRIPDSYINHEVNINQGNQLLTERSKLDIKERKESCYSSHDENPKDSSNDKIIMVPPIGDTLSYNNVVAKKTEKKITQTLTTFEKGQNIAKTDLFLSKDSESPISPNKHVDSSVLLNYSIDNYSPLIPEKIKDNEIANILSDVGNLQESVQYKKLLMKTKKLQDNKNVKLSPKNKRSTADDHSSGSFNKEGSIISKKKVTQLPTSSLKPVCGKIMSTNQNNLLRSTTDDHSFGCFNKKDPIIGKMGATQLPTSSLKPVDKVFKTAIAKDNLFEEPLSNVKISNSVTYIKDKIPNETESSSLCVAKETSVNHSFELLNSELEKECSIEIPKKHYVEPKFDNPKIPKKCNRAALDLINVVEEYSNKNELPDKVSNEKSKFMKCKNFKIKNVFKGFGNIISPGIFQQHRLLNFLRKKKQEAKKLKKPQASYYAQEISVNMLNNTPTGKCRYGTTKRKYSNLNLDEADVKPKKLKSMFSKSTDIPMVQSNNDCDNNNANNNLKSSESDQHLCVPPENNNKSNPLSVTPVECNTFIEHYNADLVYRKAEEILKENRLCSYDANNIYGEFKTLCEQYNISFDTNSTDNEVVLLDRFIRYFLYQSLFLEYSNGIEDNFEIDFESPFDLFLELFGATRKAVEGSLSNSL